MRFLRWFVITVAGLEIAYLVLANGLLLSGLAGKLFSSPNSDRVDLASAWTVFPGVVHASGLRVVFEDHNVQVDIEVAHADVTLRLRDLVRRVFHATKVRGSGVVFRSRNRVQPASAHLASVAALPPIGGFPSPPIYEAWAPPPPIPDSKYRLWTVYLEDVNVAISEIWIEQFRYLGPARATGAFRLVPVRRVWVGPDAALELRGGTVRIGDREALSGFSGHIDCTVDPFDVRIPTGLQVMRFISGHVRVAGDVTSLGALNLFFPSIPPVDVSTGTRLDVQSTIDHGTLKPPSHVALHGNELDVEKPSFGVRVKGPYRFTAALDGKDGQGHADVETTDVYARDSDLWVSTHLSAHAERGASAGKTERGALHGSATLTDVHVKSGQGPPSRWNAALPNLTVTASRDAGSQPANGMLHVAAPAMHATVGKTTLRADLTSEMRFAPADGGSALSVAGNAALSNVDLKTKRGSIDGWWARLRFEPTHVALENGVTFDGRVVAKVRDGVPALDVLASEDQVPKWLPGVLPLHNLDATLDLHQRCGLTDVQIRDASGGPLYARGRIQHSAGDTRGAVLFRLGHDGVLSAGISLLPTGKTDVSLLDGNTWLGRQLAGLSDRARAACGSHSTSASATGPDR